MAPERPPGPVVRPADQSCYLPLAPASSVSLGQTQPRRRHSASMADRCASSPQSRVGLVIRGSTGYTQRHSFGGYQRRRGGFLPYGVPLIAPVSGRWCASDMPQVYTNRPIHVRLVDLAPHSRGGSGAMRIGR